MHPDSQEEKTQYPLDRRWVGSRAGLNTVSSEHRRPPPKQKRRRHTGREREVWEHRPLGIVLSPPVGKRRKTLDDCENPDWLKPPRGAAWCEWLRGGSSGNGWRVVTAEKKTEPREYETKLSPWKKKRWCACRLFGTNGLKEGAIWHVDPFLGNAWNTCTQQKKSYKKCFFCMWSVPCPVLGYGVVNIHP